MKKNPPNKEFKILQPHKMTPLDLKNPMASRAVGAKLACPAPRGHACELTASLCGGRPRQRSSREA
jgi:hypothetical protein